ncbi:phage late control D family protein [Rhodoblastus sp.]|uniref:phage late control D family protein n=1 Tax=Rhodoblastus sp. TaxID=1962975 RepID=UPI003F9E2469
MIPIIQIFLDGQDISSRFAGRIVSGEIHETDGEKTDELRLTISNYDGMLAKPAKGAIVDVSLGWVETGVVKAGQFKVLETTKVGEIAAFHVTAHAAQLDNSLKTQKFRSFAPPKTYGQVFQQIASDNNLSAAVHPSIAQIQIDAILAQHGESDMHFGMRIARGVGAILKMAQGYFTVVPKGAGQSASGQAIPALTVTPADLVGRWEIGDKERPKRGQSKANVFSRKTATRTVVSSGNSSDGPDYVHPQLFGSQTEAQNAVKARAAAFKRGQKHFRGTLRGGIFPPPAGGILTTQGFGDDDDANFSIKSLRSVFGEKGLAFSFDGEQQAT